MMEIIKGIEKPVTTEGLEKGDVFIEKRSHEMCIIQDIAVDYITGEQVVVFSAADDTFSCKLSELPEVVETMFSSTKVPF